MPEQNEPLTIEQRIARLEEIAVITRQLQSLTLRDLLDSRPSIDRRNDLLNQIAEEQKATAPHGT